MSPRSPRSTRFRSSRDASTTRFLLQLHSVSSWSPVCIPQAQRIGNVASQMSRSSCKLLQKLVSPPRHTSSMLEHTPDCVLCFVQYVMSSKNVELARQAAKVAKLYNVPMLGLPGSAHQEACKELSVEFIPGKLVTYSPSLFFHPQR